MGSESKNFFNGLCRQTVYGEPTLRHDRNLGPVESVTPDEPLLDLVHNHKTGSLLRRPEGTVQRQVHRYCQPDLSSDPTRPLKF